MSITDHPPEELAPEPPVAPAVSLREPFSSALPKALQEPAQRAFEAWVKDGTQSVEALAVLVAIEVCQTMQTWHSTPEAHEQFFIAQAEIAQLRERISILPSIVISAVLNSSEINEVTIDFDSNPHLPQAEVVFDSAGRATYRKGTPE